MDTALKQRLIGAAVLIALAVFFLPMLVKGPAPDSGVSDVSMDISDGPAGAMETRDLPLVAPGEVPKGGAVGMDATPMDRPNPDAAVPAIETTGSADSGMATTDSGAATSPAAAGGDYAVHFGAYASAKAADTVVALAKRAQLPAYSEPTKIGDKDAWRVRIGPYATRADAESARLKALEVRSDVPVKVVVLNADAAPAPTAPSPAESPAVASSVEIPKPVATKPVEPAKPESKPDTKPEAKPAVAKPADVKPAAAPKPVEIASATPKPVTTKPVELPAAPKPAAKPASSGTLVAVAPKPKPAAAAKVGFAVQLGAFANPADATALRDRLRASGFAAFTETVDTDKGKLTRVRVGPVIDRAAADQLKTQVKAKTGTDGIVRPHP